MSEIVSDDVLEAFTTPEFKALLERLPERADELRKRRSRFQHAQWRERNRKKIAEWNAAYYRSGAVPREVYRNRWTAASRRYRVRQALAKLELQLAELRGSGKGTKGNERKTLDARIRELEAKRERLTIEIEAGGVVSKPLARKVGERKRKGVYEREQDAIRALWLLAWELELELAEGLPEWAEDDPAWWIEWHEIRFDEGSNLTTPLRAAREMLAKKREELGFGSRLKALRNVTGRTPEEAEAFLRKADELERNRREAAS